MAVYRHIHIDYWQDGFVLDLTPEEKYFYIYLMTNSKTSQCGIYELPKRIIETETGYNRETVEKLIYRFEEYEKIVYCEDTKELFLKNWIKHNKVVSPKVKKCIEKELFNVKSKELIELFLKECNRYGYSIDTHNLKLSTTIDSVSIPVVEDKYNLDNHYGEKEKQKQKEKEKEEEKQKLVNSNLDSKNNFDNEEVDKSFVSNISKYKTLYEQNVGLINPIVGQWLIEVCESMDYELFKRAIEIATNKGKCNKGYINGILKQWNDNNIKSINDLKAYEIALKNRGDSYGKYKCEPSKSKYARALEEEDEGIYRKPTDEEIESVRRESEHLRER
ncbi:DnaD domain protein [Romboutsia weinsteinii]|uniref:DnaD domain protein n=1 Tax=Romboutsia weinsteinii TaxID=2020949 RepID=A0A371J6L4_9FIRM|nr:DnaD domain protein [Romboutsia weinsteinii]RDY28430.1 DnaD domain protein [Romboutsia weinsteinii]